MKQKNKRGRPRKFDEDTVIDIAMHVFWREGYGPTRLDDICQQTGLSKPSLYAAFGDKDKLYERALEYYAKRFRSRVMAAIGSAENPQQAVSKYFHEVASILTDNNLPPGCLRVNTTAECTQFKPQLSRLARKQRQQTREAIAFILSPVNANTTRVNDIAELVVTLSDGLAAAAKAGVTNRQIRITASQAAAAVNFLQSV